MSGFVWLAGVKDYEKACTALTFFVGGVRCYQDTIKGPSSKPVFSPRVESENIAEEIK